MMTSAEMDDDVKLNVAKDKDTKLLDDTIIVDGIGLTSATLSSTNLKSSASQKSIQENEEEAELSLTDDLIVASEINDGTNILKDNVDHIPLPISSSWSTIGSEFDTQSQLSLSECKTFRHENSMKSMAANESVLKDETVHIHMPKEPILRRDSYVMLITSEKKDDTISTKDETDNDSLPSGASSESETFSLISISEKEEDPTPFHENDVVQVPDTNEETISAKKDINDDDIPSTTSSTVNSESGADPLSQLSPPETKCEVQTPDDNDELITSGCKVSTISSKDDVYYNCMTPAESSFGNSQADTNASSLISLIEMGEVGSKYQDNDVVLVSKMEDGIFSSLTDHDCMPTQSMIRDSASGTDPLSQLSIPESENKAQIPHDNDEVLTSGSKDGVTPSRDEETYGNCSVSAASSILNSEYDPNASSVLSLLERGEAATRSHENDIVLVSKRDSVEHDPMLSYGSLTVDSIFLTAKEDEVEEETKKTDSLEYQYEMPKFTQSMPVCHNDTSLLFCDPLPSTDERSNVVNNNFSSLPASNEAVCCEPALDESIEVEIFHRIEKRPIIGRIRKGAVTMAGGALIGVGIPLIPTPVPGALFIAGGLSLLGTEYPEAQELLDKGRVSLYEYAENRDDEDDDQRSLLDSISSDTSTDSEMELNFVCGVIMPSRNEVDQLVNKAADNAKGVGSRMNRSLKSFVKGAILPVVNVITRKSASEGKVENSA